MAMVAGMSWDTTRMDRAMEQLSRESTRTDREIVTMNARTLCRAIAYNTPRVTGAGRGGWVPAWKALDMPGMPPKTPRGPGVWFRQQSGWREEQLGFNALSEEKAAAKSRAYTIEGQVEDRRDEVGKASFAWKNTTHVIGGSKAKRAGKPFYYLYRSNRRGPNAGWMQRAADETAMKLERLYERLLKKHSAGRTE